MTKGKVTAYLAQEKYFDALKRELKGVSAVYGCLFVAKGPPQRAVWAQNIWHEPQIADFASIADAAKLLKGIQRNWVLYSHTLHRRGTLIQSQLPHVSAKPLRFPSPLPSAPLGAFTLTGKQSILYAARTSSPFPHGEPQFVESKEGPPNRAYLKLWELFTLLQDMPDRGERCLDAGASPGGWSWVLSGLGARVLAVDRAVLAPEVARSRNIEFEKGDAFAVVPQTHGSFDWVFCDVAAYPDKLYEWVKHWVKSGKCKHLAATIKFQGTGQYDVLNKFAAIPNSRLLHLSANKHEITFYWSKKGREAAA